MSHFLPAPLKPFVADELSRAPRLIDTLLQTLQRPRAFADTPGLEARWINDLQAALVAAHADMAARFCQSLAARFADDAVPGIAHAQGPTTGFSLVDDDEVNTDVELSRVVEAIASTAEHELRELRAYTSAVVGDTKVARDTNPFGPALYARALWAAAGALPLSHGFRMAFMRRAALPLAQALRLAYAAACTRLEDAGIEPAAYQTLVLAAGTRTVRPDERETEPPPHLPSLRNSMPASLDAPADAFRHARPPEVDQQSIELLSRLFDAILSDPQLNGRVQVLISRLQASALRVALRDPDTLDAYSHPVWLFVDRLAFMASLQTDDREAVAVLDRLQAIVDNLARETQQDAALFRWGIDRLSALDRHLLARRLHAAAEQIALLEALDAPGNSALRTAPETPVPLDVATLDTVPADLLTTPAERGPARSGHGLAWLDQQEPGSWVSIFLQGEWRLARLLWRGNAAWLYAGTAAAGPWALRRAALERLNAEGLLRPWTPRSLVRRAAAKVLRQVQSA